MASSMRAMDEKQRCFWLDIRAAGPYASVYMGVVAEELVQITAGPLAVKQPRMYRFLRPVFVVGLILSLTLYFLPYYKPAGDVLKAWLSMGGVERRLSSFDLCRLLLSTGNVQWGIFYIALSAVELALLLLALRRPRRWVFIAGSCEQLYLVIAFMLRPSSDALSQPSFFAFLLYVCWAMCLTGFFVKPPRTLVTARLRPLARVSMNRKRSNPAHAA